VISFPWITHNSWSFSGKNEERKSFSSIEDIIALDGIVVSRDKISYVKKVTHGTTNYYVKVYWRGGNGIRRFIGRGRLRGEWENLRYFTSLGIRTPRIVAYGQQAKYGMLKCGVLVTQEVSKAEDMLRLSQENSALFEDKQWLENVIVQIADYTRRLHHNGFVHWDLKWRNILVSTQSIHEPYVYFFDCPLGKRRYAWLRKRGAIKDIACLDKIAKKILSDKQRMLFFNHYGGTDRLDAKQKRKIKQILNFFN